MRIMVSVLGACCLLLPAHAQLPETIAIRAGKIITLTGQPIVNGVVLIRHGKIAAVGKNVPIPRNAKVIDASTKVVMPDSLRRSRRWRSGRILKRQSRRM